MPADATGDRLEHYVSTDPFDPHSIEALTPAQERIFLASQWRMMWWRFKRHHLAVVSGAVLVLLYLSVLVSEIIAPYDLHSRHSDFIYAPPQSVRLFDDGEFIGPFVHGLEYRLNMENLKREYSDESRAAVPAAVPVLGRPLPVLGAVRGELPPGVRRGRGHAVPARYRPARARRALAHGSRSADIAHHRAGGGSR